MIAGSRVTTNGMSPVSFMEGEPEALAPGPSVTRGLRYYAGSISVTWIMFDEAIRVPVIFTFLPSNCFAFS